MPHMKHALNYFFFGLSLTGITNFNPDQTSVTAQVLMSTNPAPSPLSVHFFVRHPLLTLELFFRQAIHSIPAGARAFAAVINSRSSTARDSTNRKTKSRSPRAGFAVWRRLLERIPQFRHHIGGHMHQCDPKPVLDSEFLWPAAFQSIQA